MAEKEIDYLALAKAALREGVPEDGLGPDHKAALEEDRKPKEEPKKEEPKPVEKAKAPAKKTVKKVSK